MVDAPRGDLDRAISHEPNTDWPDEMAIVATWIVEGAGNRPRRIHKRVTVPRDAFFGARGAPLTGDWFIAVVNRLRNAYKR